MSQPSRFGGTIWVLRLLAIAVAVYLLSDLLRQFLAGSISMGHGEFNDRIVVTSAGGRWLAVLMWGTFLGGVLLAGVSPALFYRHRWLAPAFLIAVFFWYALFSLFADKTFQ